MASPAAWRGDRDRVLAGLRRAVVAGRLIPHGLRWRLTAWVAVVLLLASAVMFVAIYRGTGSELRGQIDNELRSAAAAFAHQVSVAAPGGPAAVEATGRAYVHDQPFRATSRVLYLVVGGSTVSNAIELLGFGAPDNDESVARQNAENRLGRSLLGLPSGFSTRPAAEAGPLRLLILPIRQGGRVVARIGVGEPLASVSAAQRGVARAFLLAGALLFGVALLASYLVGVRVSRPLRRMAGIAARVNEGDLEHRIHSRGARGDEVRVLADGFDRMLDRLADAFARQRTFVSDASHELRTPLTVIAGQMELLAREQDPPAAEVRRVERLVQGEVSRMSRLVDDLLVLAHSDEAEFVRLEEIDVEQWSAELWSGLAHMGDRDFTLSVTARGVLRADPDRLAQAVRNLVRNAVDHTQPSAGRVFLEVSSDPMGRARFSVQDDGPGIPMQQRLLVFDRFHRTDVARNRALGGAGLGLAIVRAIAEAHGGSVTAAASAALGGARVDLVLPRFRAREPSGVMPRDPATAYTPRPSSSAALPPAVPVVSSRARRR